MWLLPAAREKVAFAILVRKGWALGMERPQWQRALERQTRCCQVLGGKEER